MQTHITTRRRNRVYKSLHKPLTYLGVERTLFYFVCVGAVGVFNLFNSLLAGVAITCATMPPNRVFPAWRWSNAATRQSHQAVERGRRA